MSKDIYVYSTLSNDQNYTVYHDGRETPQANAQILIVGKANVATKHFVTPRGVVTKITEEQLAVLQGIELFQIHVANGFIEVSDKKDDAELVAASMTGRDESAPLVEQDIPEDVGVISNAAPEEDEPAPTTRRGRRS